MKTFILTVIVCFIFVNLTNYPQQYRWAKGIGGIASDRGGGITADKSGNVYIVGTFREANVDFDPGADTLLLSSKGGDDTYFAKYDSSGNCLWAKSIGGTNDDVGMRILVDEADNIYIGGWFGSIQVDFDPGPGTHILNAEAATNIWFAKYDTDGNFIWAYCIGGGWMAGIHDIWLDRNGSLLTAGYFCGTNVNFNPKSSPVLLSSIGNSGDIFFAKYDTSGTCIFANSCSGGAYEVANTIRTDLSDNIYIFGPFQSTVDFDPGPGTASLSSAGNYDIFFAKYSPSGNYIWANRIGGSGLENSGGLAVDPDGYIYLSGCFSGANIDFDPGAGTSLLNSNGGTDICLAKYDSDGNYLWASSTGGTADDNPVSTSIDSNNNIYQSGLFRGQNIDFDPGPRMCNLSSAGGCDVYLSRYNSSGNLIWAFKAGGASDDFSSASVNDTSGNVFITGAFSGSNVDFDPGTGFAPLSSNGVKDIFFAKYSIEVRNPYLGLAMPDTIPVRFGTPDLISNGIWWWHGSPVFSPEGNEMFFVKYIDTSGYMEIYEMDNINGEWTTPFSPSFASDSSDNSPVFSADGNSLMFTSKRSGFWRFYHVSRTSTGWAAVQPVNFDYSSFPEGIGTTFSLAADSTLYFSAWTQQNSLQLYRAYLINGIYSQFEELPEPINSTSSEGSACIAPDQSYIIFDSDRPGSLGLHDIYLSFKKSDGSWTSPVNLGSRINGTHEDAFPRISSDGKFLFFNSAKPGDLGYNAYWVSSAVIDKLNPLVSVEDYSDFPAEMNLYQNFPNPFNPVTTIKYSLVKEGKVKLNIYNALGCTVATLVNEYKAPGIHSVQFNGEGLASGIYFCRLESGNYSFVKKLVLIK